MSTRNGIGAKSCQAWWALLRGLLTVVVPLLACLWISGYQNAQRAQGQPGSAILEMVASLCLLLSLMEAIALPRKARRRSRG